MSRKKKVTGGDPRKRAAKGAVGVAKPVAKSSGWVPSGSLDPRGDTKASDTVSAVYPVKTPKAVPSAPMPKTSYRNRKKARKQAWTKAFVVGMVVVLSAILAGSILVSTPSMQAPGNPYEVPSVETE